MIVKNESRVIKRCIDSVRSIISSWSIVDTGSTDGTQDIIRNCLKDLPGKLYERPWRNFGENRSEAIELAKGKADYDLVIDADDVLEIPKYFTLPELTHDAYNVMVEYSDLAFLRPHIFKNDNEFYYECVIHEYLACRKPHSTGELKGVVYKCVGGGDRHQDPEKYEKDAAVLKKALEKEPNNHRYVFYLGQSFKDAATEYDAACRRAGRIPDPGRWSNLCAKSIAAYERRAKMGGFAEEVYLSLLEIAKIRERMGAPEERIVAAYLRAYESRPSRVEPLYELARYYRAKDRFAAGYLYAKAGAGRSMPNDLLFIDRSAHEWRIFDECAVHAFYLGFHEESRDINRALLASGKLPESERERIEKNLGFSLAALGQNDVR